MKGKYKDALVRYLPLIPLYTFIALILVGIIFGITVSYFLALIPLAYMIFKGIIGNVISHFAISRIRKNMERAPHIQLPEEAKNVHHVVMIPVFREGSRYLYKRIVESINNNGYPHDEISVIFVTEVGDDESRNIVHDCMNEYSNVYEIAHPKEENILPGKSAAMAYAGKVLGALVWPEDYEEILKDNVELLRDSLGKKLAGKHVLVHDTDIDMLFPPGYFRHVTKMYLEDEDRKLHAYQPAILLINNFEKVPNISMTTGVFVSYNALGGQYSKTLMMFSSYAMDLELLRRVGYWRNDIVQEDSGLYWKAKMLLGKDFKVVPLFMPLFGDAVNTGEWKSTFAAQTKQIIRWAYGVDDIRHNLLEYKAPLKWKIYSVLLIFQNHVLWETGGFLGAYTYFLPLLFVMPVPKTILVAISVYFTTAWPLTWVGAMSAMKRLIALRNSSVGTYLNIVPQQEKDDMDQFSSFASRNPLVMAALPTLMLPMLDAYRQTNIAIPLEVTSIGGLYLLQYRNEKYWIKNGLLLLTYPAALFYNSLCAFYAAHVVALKGKIKYEVTKKV